MEQMFEDRVHTPPEVVNPVQKKIKLVVLMLILARYLRITMDHTNTEWRYNDLS
jgi:hypothetical protein